MKKWIDRIDIRESIGVIMPPIWPFKKKQIVEQEEPERLMSTYENIGDKANDTSHKDSQDYKAALALFGNGSENLEAAEDQSDKYDGITSNSSNQQEFEWVENTDGYFYKLLANGEYEQTAYVRNQDGSYSAYE